MTTLFDKNNLDTHRYISIGLSILPALGIYGGSLMLWKDSEDAGNNIVGRPDSWVFSFVWSVIIILWVLALILASFHFDKNWLVGLHVLSFITTLLAVLWMYYYNDDKKETSAQILIATNLFACLSLFATLSATSDNKTATGIATLCIVPLFVWTNAATLFNYIEINNE